MCGAEEISNTLTETFWPVKYDENLSNAHSLTVSQCEDDGHEYINQLWHKREKNLDNASTD